MALDSNVAFVNTDGVSYPDNAAVNATGPTETDGTEFVKIMVDNYMFGPQQALLNYAGLSPNGISEEDGNSQTLESLQKAFSHPGELVTWFGNSDPGALGLRVLLLQGQGVLVANYPELTTAVYTGDGTNATAGAFFRADDAAGTIRNIAGAFLIMAEARGAVIRGLDDTALIDIDGAGTRLPGDFQDDAFQGHYHNFSQNGAPAAIYNLVSNAGSFGGITVGTTATGNTLGIHGPSTGIDGTPRTTDQTRMKNISAHLAIRY